MVKPVSGACNMRCGYCFYRDVSSRRERENLGRMTGETLETLVRRAMNYADGSVSFAFQGGEPTLAGLDFFETLMRLEKKYNSRNIAVSNSVQTNGYDVPDAMIRFFAENSFLIGVSLDGDRETHDLMRVDAAGKGTWERIRGAIERMREAGCMVNILTVVNRHVARRPREIWKALSEYGYLQFIPCLDDLDGGPSPHSLTAEDYGPFLIETFALYEAAWRAGKPVSVRNFDNYLGMLLGQPPENCAMGGQCGVYYLIEADGSVYPCDFYVLDEYRMGNVRESSFHKLAASPVGTAFRAASHPVDPACARCEYLALCRGGCRRDREPLESGKDPRNRFCTAYKAFFGACLPRMERMAREIGRGRRLP